MVTLSSVYLGKIVLNLFITCPSVKKSFVVFLDTPHDFFDLQGGVLEQILNYFSLSSSSSHNASEARVVRETAGRTCWESVPWVRPA